jgi:cell division cycle 14
MSMGFSRLAVLAIAASNKSKVEAGAGAKENMPMPILTYVPDRLYLGAYLRAPDADTLFPYPEASVSPRKRGQTTASQASTSRKTPCYFSVDDILLYNAFHHDFGPLHIGHLYRFAIQFHDILGAKENKDRPIVFWSAADPRSESIEP